MLSQELRPKRWEDVAGQKENVNILKAIVKNPENSPKCLIFQGAFGSGKCVVGDTRVETSLGYVKIKDILGDNEPRFDSEGFMDISDYDIRVLGGRKATHFYYGGEQDTVKISSKFFELEGTKNHKVMCLTDNGIEWVRLGDITKDSYVCVSSSSKKVFPFLNSVPMFSGLEANTVFNNGYLFGAILQGGKIVNNTVEFLGDDNEISYILSLFSDSYRETIEMRKVRRGNKGKIVFKDSGFYVFVTYCYGMREGEDNTVPEWVYRSSEYFLSGVLSAIFDFSVGLEESGNVCIVLRHRNKDLVRLFSDILKLFGVSNSLKRDIKRKEDRLFCIVRDFKGVKDFSDLISPFNTGLDNELIRMMEPFRDKDSNTTIPKTEYVRGLIDKITKRAKDCKVKLLGSFTSKGDKSIKESTLRAMVDRLPVDNNIGEWTDFLTFLEDYRFVQIESIEYGRDIVYDLTVDDTHCFIANGILNHNTTSARILARELNKIKDDDFDIVNSKFYYEFDSTVIGNVDAVRGLREEFTVSYGDYWRVVVLDEAHAVSNAAQNALLKMLEETTGKTLYIMATTEVNKLLPTIRSRSLELQFNPVPQDEIFKNLTKVCEDRGIIISDDIKRLIAERSYGHMRNAHMMLDKFLLIGEEDFKDSIKSSVSLYCDYLIAIYDNDREKVLSIINSLMDIPKNNLQSDWNIVMVESLKSFCGFETDSEDVKRLVQKYGSDFNIVSSCYMSSWIRNAFQDMSYFQATFLNLFMVVRGALNKKSSSQVSNNKVAGNSNRFGSPVR